MARGITLLVLAALVTLSLWEGTLSRQSAAAHWSVTLVAIVTVAAALIAGRGRQRTGSGAWLTGAVRAIGRWRRTPLFAAGIAVWVLLVLTVIGWDLNSFVHQAHDLPTLSYYFGRVTRWWWGRALVFAAWLAVGGYLAVGWRRGQGRRQ
jgi:hypothetical protein